MGNFSAFEKWRFDSMQDASQKVKEKITEIKTVTGNQESKLLLVVAPASVQVCKPSDLAYYPRHVDLFDSDLYDIEMPQKLFSQVSTDLESTMVDLRSAFRNVSECPYQPKNMHWTSSGHEWVSNYLTDYLIRENMIGTIP